MSQAESFPRWRFHPEHEARIVRSKEQNDALGEGWYDSPAQFLSAEVHAEPVVEAPAEVEPGPAPASKESKPRGKRVGRQG
jgi:hypothetical protein